MSIYPVITVEEVPLPAEFEVHAEDVRHSIIHGIILQECKVYGVERAIKALEAAAKICERNAQSTSANEIRELMLDLSVELVAIS